MSKLNINITVLVSILAVSFLFSCVSTNNDKKKQTAQYKIEIANSLIKRKSYPAALKELLSAEEDDPNNPQIQEYLGHVYYARERFELAEKHYLKSLQMDPKYTDVRNSLAVLYLETGRFSKAEEQLKIAIEDLTYVPYYRTLANLGSLEFKRKNYPKAVDYLKKSLDKDRENCDTNVLLGRAQLEGGEIADAVLQLEKSISFCYQAESDLAHYYSAIALYRKKEVARAQARFEELVRVFPNGPHNERSRKMLSLIKSETP